MPFQSADTLFFNLPVFAFYDYEYNLHVHYNIFFFYTALYERTTSVANLHIFIKTNGFKIYNYAKIFCLI